jgi:NADH-quinone oxidoreductase subunit J
MDAILLSMYGLLIFAAVLMVICLNPIHAVIFFILVFFSASMIFTMLHVDFIGLVFLMVYVGAIAVLFIFVVMMLNIKRMERDSTTYVIVGGSIFILFTIQLIYVQCSSYVMYAPDNLMFCDTMTFDYFTNSDEFLTRYVVTLLGVEIFTRYAIVLIFSGITLLIALIGSIFLTNMTSGYSQRRQDNQLVRNNKLLNLHIY